MMVRMAPRVARLEHAPEWMPFGSYQSTEQARSARA
jgi:hypothetical protein